jgi:hypothetical protein
MVKATNSVDIESTPEFTEGWAAWKNSHCQNPYGKGLDARLCPYPSEHSRSAQRTAFMAGFWSGVVTDFLERFEAKYSTR